MRNSPASSKASSNPGSNSFAATSPKDYSTNNSVEYTHEELRNATNGFSVANEIGAGGFAVVYYGEIRGQVFHSLCAELIVWLSLHFQAETILSLSHSAPEKFL